MQEFRDILIAIDPSQDGFGRDGTIPDEARSAIDHALWLHKHNPGAKLTLMAVVGGDQQEAKHARDLLDVTAMRLLEGTGAECVVRLGEPYIEISRAVQEQGHKLLIVAARRHGLVHRNIVGSTALRLLRYCPSPVWVTPRFFSQDPAVVLSSVGFHGLSARILELSASVVKATEGSWHVLHCMEYFEEGGMRLRDATRAEIAEYRERARERDWERMHALTDSLAEKIGVQPKFWLAEGQPDEQIGLAARQINAVVLVMGTVGRTGLPGFVIGNTAEKLLTSIECSVLAVKPEGFVSPLSS